DVRLLGRRPRVDLAQVVDRPAGGDDDEQPPEAVAVEQLGEPAGFRPQAKALEGAQGHVFRVGPEPRLGLKRLAGQCEEPGEVTPEEFVGRGGVASLELLNPPGDGLGGGHGQGTPGGPYRAQDAPIVRASGVALQCPPNEDGYGTAPLFPARTVGFSRGDARYMVVAGARPWRGSRSGFMAPLRRRHTA